jgi:hypothetical protein
VGNVLVLQGNMECGIYPEATISYVKIGMILINSKPEKEFPGLHSLCFIRSYPGALRCMEREGWNLRESVLFKTINS